MTEIPSWWLIVSAVFFGLGILAFIALIVVLLNVNKTVSEVRPQITATVDRVNAVATKVEGVTDSVKATVDELSVKAKGIANTTEGAVGRVAAAAASQSPWIAGAMAAIRLFTMVKQAHQAKKALPAPKKGAGH